MAAREIRLEQLLTRRVCAPDGAVVGPIESVRAQVGDGRTCIVEFHVGAFALAQRLAGSAMRRSLLRLVGGRRRGGSYVVPWDVLDLSDPERPRLRCPVDQVKRAQD